MYNYDDALGIYGLGVMGQALALNFAGRGVKVAVCNRDDPHELSGPAFARACKESAIIGAVDAADLVSLLKRPRVILLTVTAGTAVDTVVSMTAPYCEQGDCIMDCGNSYYRDTEQRQRMLEPRGINFIGCGVSGGPKGALTGSCFMPGGPEGARGRILPLLEKAAARLQDGAPACAWIGPGGAGHFVKMAHNGIEYGMMQGIVEAYHLMRRLIGMDIGAVSAAFEEWGGGELEGYLVRAASRILRHREQGVPLVDVISDAAGEKGTGRDAVRAAAELGVPISVIEAAVWFRLLSGRAEERTAARSAHAHTAARPDAAVRLDDIRDALWCTHAVAVAQGMALAAAGSSAYGWGIDRIELARIWQAGCIIRGSMTRMAHEALASTPYILDAPLFREELKRRSAGWRRTVAAALQAAQPVPAMAAALSYFDTACAKRLPADLIQAQRDFFGGHGFERSDAPGVITHGDWEDEDI